MSKCTFWVAVVVFSVLHFLSGLCTASWMSPVPTESLTFETHAYDVIVQKAPEQKMGELIILLPAGWRLHNSGLTGISYNVINDAMKMNQCRSFFFQVVGVHPQTKNKYLTAASGKDVLKSEVFNSGIFTVKRSTFSYYPGNPKLHTYTLSLMSETVIVLFSVEGLEGEIEKIIDVVEHVAQSVILDGKGTGVAQSPGTAVQPKETRVKDTNPAVSGVDAVPEMKTPAVSVPATEQVSSNLPQKEGIVTALWLGKAEDRVGAWGQASADGTTDLCFSLRLSLPEKKTVEYVNLYKCDAAGNRGAEYWFSRDYNQAWILGVFENGTLLNPATGKSLGAFSGDVALRLYANDPGIPVESAFFQVEVSVAGTVHRRIVSTAVKTENLRTIGGNGTLYAAGHGKHRFSVHEIDASAVNGPGILVIDIEIGRGTTPASVDLFGQNQKVPTDGVPVSLAHAYDLPPGTKAQMKHPFAKGEKFTLGFGGSWMSPAGSTNTYAFRCSIQGNQAASREQPQSASAPGTRMGSKASSPQSPSQGEAPLPMNLNGRWEDASGRTMVISVPDRTIQTSAGGIQYTCRILNQKKEENALLLSAQVTGHRLSLPDGYPDVLAEADRAAAQTAVNNQREFQLRIVQASTGAIDVFSGNSVAPTPERFMKK